MTFPSRRAVGALAVLALVPVCAGAQSTSATQGGVQIIDMNPQPGKAPKHPGSPPVKPPAAAALPGADALVHNAMTFVGTPYKKGGDSPAGFDGPGFTEYAFATIGIRIPRLADKQFYGGRAIAGDPLPGDLVFFQTSQYGPSHVGIYLGNRQFVDAIGKNVRVDSFDDEFFKSRYLGAKRYLPG